ncbi:MAG: hypothetical protein AAGF06_08435 [Pseudomonadota bacterium]
MKNALICIPLLLLLVACGKDKQETSEKHNADEAAVTATEPVQTNNVDVVNATPQVSQTVTNVADTLVKVSETPVDFQVATALQDKGETTTVGAQPQVNNVPSEITITSVVELYKRHPKHVPYTNGVRIDELILASAKNPHLAHCSKKIKVLLKADKQEQIDAFLSPILKTMLTESAVGLVVNPRDCTLIRAAKG